MAKFRDSDGRWRDGRSGRFARAPNTWEGIKALERQIAAELEAEGWRASVTGVSRKQLGGDGLGDAVRVWSVEGSEDEAIDRTDAALMLKQWKMSGVPDAFDERGDERYLVAVKIELEDGTFEWRNISAAEDWGVALGQAINAANDEGDHYGGDAAIVGVAITAI